MIGVHLAADLVNLAVEDRWLLDEIGIIFEFHRVRYAARDINLGELLSWVQQLRGVFAAVDLRARCAVINQMLAVGAQQVHLAIHDDLPPHLHFVDDERGLTDRVRAATIGGIAIFAVEARASRMGICARPRCERVYIDTSRAGSRNYCSATCGNNHAVQRYRKRLANAS